MPQLSDPSLVVTTLAPEQELTISLHVKRTLHAELGLTLEEYALGIVNGTITKILTHEEFDYHFGSEPADFDLVAAWAQAHQLTVLESHTAIGTIKVSGSVGSFNSLFQVELKSVDDAAQGRTYISHEGEWVIPQEIAGVVDYVLGLDNSFPLPRSSIVKHDTVQEYANPDNPGAADLAAPAGISAGARPLTPVQVANAYNFPANGGTGQCIAILSPNSGSGYRQSDLISSFAQIGRSPPTIVNNYGGFGNNPGGTADGEIMLDIWVAGAVAPDAQIVVYFNEFVSSVNDAVNDTVNNPSVISISYAWDESWMRSYAGSFFKTTMESALAGAVAKGITVTVADGDWGPYGPSGFLAGTPSNLPFPHQEITVCYPASSPYVLSCGGTNLVLDTQNNIYSEGPWTANQDYATGGGQSVIFDKPSWQTGLSYSTYRSDTGTGSPTAVSKRAIPDVAGPADPSTGYTFYVNGSAATYGGTSAVAPLWAGLVARINATAGTRMGLANARLYQNPGTFRDISATGNNAVIYPKLEVQTTIPNNWYVLPKNTTTTITATFYGSYLDTLSLFIADGNSTILYNQAKSVDQPTGFNGLYSATYVASISVNHDGHLTVLAQDSSNGLYPFNKYSRTLSFDVASSTYPYRNFSVSDNLEMVTEGTITPGVYDHNYTTSLSDHILSYAAKTPWKPAAASSVATTTIQTLYDLPYGTNFLQKVDVILPYDNGYPTPRGVVIHVHGGAWSGGSKSSSGFSSSDNAYNFNDEAECIKVAQAGYIVINCNYRITSLAAAGYGGDGTGGYPNSIDDIKTILQYCLVNGAGHSTDARWDTVQGLVNTYGLLVTGSSAGGHLAVMAVGDYGTSSGNWPLAVGSTCGPMDLVYSLNGNNDNPLDTAIQNLVNSFSNPNGSGGSSGYDDTKAKASSPRYRYGTAANPGPWYTAVNNSACKFYFIQNNNDTLVKNTMVFPFIRNLKPNDSTLIRQNGNLKVIPQGTRLSIFSTFYNCDASYVLARLTYLNDTISVGEVYGTLAGGTASGYTAAQTYTFSNVGTYNYLVQFGSDNNNLISYPIYVAFGAGDLDGLTAGAPVLRGYASTTGWDALTGLGSPNGTLITSLYLTSYVVAAAGGATSVNEGSSLTFNVNTPTLTDGTTLYWNINYNSSSGAADFTGGPSGSFTVSSNAGSFAVTLTADSITEGAESFIAQVFTDAGRTTLVGSSAAITINDTSLAFSNVAYVLIVGQSNIANYGIYTDSYTPTGDVQRLTINGAWETAVSPAGADRLATGYNFTGGSGSATPGGPSGGNMDGRIGDAIIAGGAYTAVKIVNVAVGGTPLGWWLSTASPTDYYGGVPRSEDNFPYTNTKLYERIQYAATTATTQGFAFTHVLLGIGESDATFPNFTPAATYQSRFAQFKTDLTNLGITAPIWISQTSYTIYDPWDGSVTSVNSTITNAQQVIVDTYSNVYAGPNTDYYGDSYRHDHLHFKATGLTSIGADWGAQILAPSDTFTHSTSPTYVFGTYATSVDEGSSITVNVVTSNLSSGSTLYWTVLNGTTTDARFSSVSGSFTVDGTGRGSFSVAAIANNTTNGITTFQVQLRTESITGTVKATTNAITINDTSQSASTYTFTVTPTSVNEGSAATFTLNATNVVDGTNLYWSVDYNSSSSSADFTGGTTGTFAVYSNYGSFQVSITADSLTEGAETFKVRVYTDSSRTTLVATSAAVAINDTSTTTPGTPTTSFITVPSSVDEGSPGAFSISTANYSPGTLFFWTILNGTTNSSDFSATSGQLTIDSQGYTSFTVTPRADLLTEGAETFQVQIRIDSVSGTVQATSPSITINDISLSPATYVFSSVPTSINEGSTGSFGVATTGVAQNTVLWWTIDYYSSSSSSDFSNQYGSFVIDGSGNGTIDITPTADQLTEGTEYFRLEIRTGSRIGTVQRTSGVVTINDTSTTPVTYQFSNYPVSIDESKIGTFNIQTTSVPQGTRLYWTILHGTTDVSDFFAVSNSFTIDSSGNGGFTITPSGDSLTEGPETFQVEIRTGSISGPVQVTTPVITVNDTSTAGPAVATYSFNIAPSSINEGSAGSFTVSTTNVGSGTTLYWTVLNSTTSNVDFSATSGSFAIDTYGYGTFTVTPTADHLTEGAETFQVEVRTDSITGTVQATSPSVTVNDTSLTPVKTYSFTTTPTSINEGAAGAFTLSTTNVDTGTVLNWYINYNSSSNSADFSTVSGTVTIDSLGKGLIVVNPTADLLTEGVEIFQVEVRTQSGTLLATSNPVSINDTSKTPTGINITFPSAIDEGRNGPFVIRTDKPAGTILWWTIDYNQSSGGAPAGVPVASVPPVVVTSGSSAADFTAVYGSFTVDSTGTGSFNIKPRANATTDSTLRTFRVQIRNNSRTGTILSVSPAIIISDTSQTPITISGNTVPSVGDFIMATDFDTLYNSLFATMGTIPSGYGATMASSSVVAGDIIGYAEWSGLYDDIRRCHVHQWGPSAPIYGNPVRPRRGDVVTAANVGTLTSVINFLYENRNHATVLSEIAANTDNGTSINTGTWDSQISHNIEYSWIDADNVGYFFNLSGSIQPKLSYDNITVGSTATAWRSLINTFNAKNYIYTGTDFSEVVTTATAADRSITIAYSRNDYKVTRSLSLITLVADEKVDLDIISTSTVYFSTDINGGIVAPIPQAIPTKVLTDTGNYASLSSAPSPVPTIVFPSGSSNSVTITLTNNGNINAVITDIVAVDDGNSTGLTTAITPTSLTISPNGGTQTFTLTYGGTPSTNIVHSCYLLVKSNSSAGDLKILTSYQAVFAATLTPIVDGGTVLYTDLKSTVFTIVTVGGILDHYTLPTLTDGFYTEAGATLDTFTVYFDPKNKTNGLHSTTVSFTVYSTTGAESVVSSTINWDLQIVEQHLGNWVSAQGYYNSVIGISYNIVGGRRQVSIGIGMGYGPIADLNNGGGLQLPSALAQLDNNVASDQSPAVLYPFQIANSGYCDFLLRYGVWNTANQPYTGEVWDTTGNPYNMYVKTTKTYNYEISSDNAAELYIDGLLIDVSTATGNSDIGTINLTAGLHTISWIATNVNDGGPGSVAIRIYDDAGTNVWSTLTPISEIKYWLDLYEITLDGTARDYYCHDYQVRSYWGTYFGSGNSLYSIITVTDDGNGNLSVNLNNLRQYFGDTGADITLNALTETFYYYSENYSRYNNLENPVNGSQTHYFTGFDNQGNVTTTLVNYPIHQVVIRDRTGRGTAGDGGAGL